MSDGRLLHMAECTVDDAARPAYLASLASRRSACLALGVQFWVFEHTEIPGRFVEFTEARDGACLDLAPGNASAAGQRWRAVEVG